MGLLLAQACPKKLELPSWPLAAPEAGVSMATAERKAGCCKQGRPEESPQEAPAVASQCMDVLQDDPHQTSEF